MVTVFLLTTLFANPAAHAANSPALDTLLARLPKPESFAKSPLQTALRDPDPLVREPEFREMVVSIQKRDPRRALAAVRVLATKYPKRSVIHFVRGVLALEFGFNTEAEDSFRRAAELEPSAPAAWKFLAMSQSAQNHFTEGVVSARRAVEAGPKEPGAWSTLSMLQVQAGRSREALASAQRAADIAPDSPAGWAMLGSIYASEKQFPAAIRSYRRALAIAPGNLTLRQSEAYCLVANHQPAEAIAPFRQIVGRNPRAYEAGTQLAACYLMTGNPVQCGISCRQALAVKGDYAPAWKLLGASCERQGKTRDAANAYKKAVKFAPNDAESRARLAVITAKR